MTAQPPPPPPQAPPIIRPQSTLPDRYTRPRSRIRLSIRDLIIAVLLVTIICWCLKSRMGILFGSPLDRSVKAFATAEEDLLRTARAAGGMDAAWIPEVVMRVRVGVDVPAHYASPHHLRKLSWETQRKWARWEDNFIELRAVLAQSNSPNADLKKLSESPDNRIQQIAKAAANWQY